MKGRRGGLGTSTGSESSRTPRRGNGPTSYRMNTQAFKSPKWVAALDQSCFEREIPESRHFALGNNLRPAAH